MFSRTLLRATPSRPRTRGLATLAANPHIVRCPILYRTRINLTDKNTVHLPRRALHHQQPQPHPHPPPDLTSGTRPRRRHNHLPPPDPVLLHRKPPLQPNPPLRPRGTRPRRCQPHLPSASPSLDIRLRSRLRRRFLPATWPPPSQAGEQRR